MHMHLLDKSYIPEGYVCPVHSVPDPFHISTMQSHATPPFYTPSSATYMPPAPHRQSHCQCPMPMSIHYTRHPSILTSPHQPLEVISIPPPSAGTRDYLRVTRMPKVKVSIS
ncbi:hypothetical protein L208DRAFT_920726 [Tricholoma matsutake]|nr:hypothetical protein L208DRAFT_920726 [Tricholoma matsutake 945]